MSRNRLVLPALAAAAVLVSGCGQTQWLDEVGQPAMPTDARGLAAFLRDGTASIRSAHIEVVADAAGTSITGSGDQQLANGKPEAFDLTETIPGAGEVRIVLVDDQTYVQLPAAINPVDKPWLLISADSSDPSIQQLATSLSAITDSSSIDQYTAFAEAATVRVVGEEQVDGVDTTHYALSVDVTELPNDTPGRADILSAGLVKLPVDLWVDEQGRSVQVSQEIEVQGQTVTTKVNLSDFDEPVDISAPPADQVATG